MNIMRTVKKCFRRRTLPEIPVKVRHAEYSLIMSADDDVGRPSGYLIDLALRAAERAESVSMKKLVERMKEPPYYPDIWPGEHYKLLDALVAELRPKTAVEIGTASGISALAMLQSLPEDSILYTFDIFPWNKTEPAFLRESDFADGRLKQIVGNVGEPETMAKYADIFRSADFIFIDGPKDGVFERKFLDHLNEIGLSKKPILIFDDIRIWNMLAVWRGINKPKLDVTSFGHWSGTGLVHWV